MIKTLIFLGIFFSASSVFLRFKIFSLAENEKNIRSAIQKSRPMNFSDLLPLRLIMIPRKKVRKAHRVWFLLYFFAWSLSLIAVSLAGVYAISLSR